MLNEELKKLSKFLEDNGAVEEAREVMAASIRMEEMPKEKNDPYTKELEKHPKDGREIEHLKNFNLDRIKLLSELKELSGKLESYGYKVIVEQTKPLEDVSDVDNINRMGAVSFEFDSILEKLADIADTLDSEGAIKEAELVDNFIQKHAEDVVKWQKENKKSDQAKRYDSEFHHSIQIREPKKEDENVNREGGKEHHVKTYAETNVGALNTRYCPEHIGVSLGRVAENSYQCGLDGKIYNWETGWSDHEGNKHPGGSVAAQTPDSADYMAPHRIFDTRTK